MISGEADRVAANQPTPTFCIQVPTLDMNAAIHNVRNRLSLKGAKESVEKKRFTGRQLLVD